LRIVPIDYKRQLGDGPAAAHSPMKATKQTLTAALRDLLLFYDRITGNTRGGDAWTAAEVKRLEQIRKLVNP
jgi:hypothetical protein